MTADLSLAVLGVSIVISFYVIKDLLQVKICSLVCNLPSTVPYGWWITRVSGISHSKPVAKTKYPLDVAEDLF